MWSKELQEQTKEFLEEYKMAAMKHFGDSVYGVCVLKEDKYSITEHESNIVHEFESIEALINDGWAID